ncbi:MAG: 3-deoxy-manno-octulosonate cytidylyltransferase [Phycisphaerae bacterium]|nr:3-deoxy-manno-octulosonate cytidylyltransferase [Phycisphaerae bacterium]
MSVLCVIPARYGSKRFPGKALASQTGRPLIQHVVEAATRARRVDTVVVATDDERIRRAVEAFGGRVVMTRPDHACGTSRVAEAAEAFPDAEIVVNLQGDEPELDPALLDRLVDEMQKDPKIELATLAGPLAPEAAANPNAVKVVLTVEGDALYFSRAPIPLARDGEGARRAPLLLHFGIYGFRAEALRAYARMAQTPLEWTERLEQLRWLEHGRRIRVLVTDHRPVGVDTPEAYAEFVSRYGQRRKG